MDGIADANRGSLVQRMIGAATLNVATYEEVEADRTATGQAAAVVAIVAVASAIGAINRGEGGIVSGLIGAIVGWLIGAGIVYVIGTKLFGGTADWGELLRTMGFAQAPGVLNVLGIIPFLGGLVVFAVALWTLVTMVVAIRQALDFSTGKAVMTALVAWVVVFVVIGSLLAMLFGTAAMTGALLGA